MDPDPVRLRHKLLPWIRGSYFHYFAGEILTGDTEGNVMVWRSVKVIRVLKVQIEGEKFSWVGRLLGRNPYGENPHLAEFLDMVNVVTKSVKVIRVLKVHIGGESSVG